MKILKIFGIVVGIHVFFFALIFANPGCSSSSKPAPAPTDTVAKADPSPSITVPSSSPGITVATPPPIGFNPDAPAIAVPGMSDRYKPTRPNTPAATTLVTEPVKDVTPMTTYSVKSGDSLWTIANKNKIAVKDLAAANNLKTDVVLRLGQKLIIPGKAPAPAAAPAATASAPAAAPAAKPASSAMKHTVQSGESLSSIAQKYGVTQRDLAIANNISNPLKLAAGKELIIPGFDAVNGKTSTKSAGKASPAASSSPSFAPPQLVESPPVLVAQPPAPATGAIPVIRVDESSAPKKP